MMPSGLTEGGGLHDAKLVVPLQALPPGAMPTQHHPILARQ